MTSSSTETTAAPSGANNNNNNNNSTDSGRKRTRSSGAPSDSNEGVLEEQTVKVKVARCQELGQRRRLLNCTSKTATQIKPVLAESTACTRKSSCSSSSSSTHNETTAMQQKHTNLCSVNNLLPSNFQQSLPAPCLPLPTSSNIYLLKRTSTSSYRGSLEPVSEKANKSTLSDLKRNPRPIRRRTVPEDIRLYFQSRSVQADNVPKLQKPPASSEVVESSILTNKVETSSKDPVVEGKQLDRRLRSASSPSCILSIRPDLQYSRRSSTFTRRRNQSASCHILRSSLGCLDSSSLHSDHPKQQLGSVDSRPLIQKRRVSRNASNAKLSQHALATVRRRSRQSVDEKIEKKIEHLCPDSSQLSLQSNEKYPSQDNYTELDSSESILLPLSQNDDDLIGESQKSLNADQFAPCSSESVICIESHKIFNDSKNIETAAAPPITSNHHFDTLHNELVSKTLKKELVDQCAIEHLDNNKKHYNHSDKMVCIPCHHLMHSTIRPLKHPTCFQNKESEKRRRGRSVHRLKQPISSCSTMRSQSSLAGSRISQLRAEWGEEQECDKNHYLGLYLCKNIQDANAFVGTPDYFTLFKSCEQGRRVSAASRRAIVQFIIDVGRGVATPISDFSIHMAINLFDRFMSQLGKSNNQSKKEMAAKEVEVVGAACLYICSKMEDSWCLSLGDICKVFDDGSERRREIVLKWELEISREFNFMFYSPTVLDFIYKMVDLALPYLQQETVTVFNTNGDHHSQPIHQEINQNNHMYNEQHWDIRTVPYVAGANQPDLSSPSVFCHGNALTDLIVAKAMSIGELALMHHTSIGFPVHLIAAAALLVAITQLLGKDRRIDHLPQPVRAFLGKDRLRLGDATTIVALIVDERNAITEAHTPKAISILQDNQTTISVKRPLTSSTSASLDGEEEEEEEEEIDAIIIQTPPSVTLVAEKKIVIV